MADKQLKDKGNKLFSQGKYEAAIEAYSQAIVSPNSFYPYVSLWNLLWLSIVRRSGCIVFEFLSKYLAPFMYFVSLFVGG